MFDKYTGTVKYKCSNSKNEEKNRKFIKTQWMSHVIKQITIFYIGILTRKFGFDCIFFFLSGNEFGEKNCKSTFLCQNLIVERSNFFYMNVRENTRDFLLEFF